MLDSAIAFRKEIENLEFNNFEIGVVKNITGELYSNTDDMKSILEKRKFSFMIYILSL